MQRAAIRSGRKITNWDETIARFRAIYTNTLSLCGEREKRTALWCYMQCGAEELDTATVLSKRNQMT